MFRRSRFSVRPNVGAVGRTTTAAAASASQEPPAVSKDAGDTPKNISEGSATASESDNKPAAVQSDKPATQGDGSDQSAEASSSSAAVQRRKRFSIKPKVAPGRPAALARAQKSPVKAASQTPVQAKDSTSDKLTSTSQTPVSEPSKGPLSPRNRRPSEENKQSKPQPKPSLVQSDCSDPPGVAAADDSPNKVAENAAGSQVKDGPFKVPDKVPPSLPDKEAMAISERAKALVSTKMRLSASPAAYTLSRLLNDRSDLQRLAKAQKLRDLMKKEVHKERRKRRANLRPKEFTLDPAKMTMRDLIHYLPESNPMTTSLEDPAENEITVPPSPEREDSPERAQEPDPPPKAASVSGEDEDEAAATGEDEEQEEALLVPQVKVAEDGSLIIDEESLTVEVQRAKGPNPANEREPIFERGSTTTYSSFRKGTYSKPWSSEETDMFFLAISMVGTDFSMICQLFPHRARSEIKNKFKKEERENAWRIDKAFKDRQKLDIEYFSKLLEKILEVQKNRKKLKSLSDKNSPRKSKRKSKGSKAAKKLSDVEEEDEDDMPDLEGEEEGEKENEDLCNDGGTPGPKPKRKRRRAREHSAATNEPNDKKNKVDANDEQEEEACTPEGAEAALPGDPADSESAGQTEDVREDAPIKPAKLSRGRAPKPVLQLGRRRGKKPPASPRKPRDDASETREGDMVVETPAEQESEDASPAMQDSKRKSGSEGASSEDEGAAVLPPRPTRYGRMPKPTKPLTYSARDDSPPSPGATHASPPGSPTKSTKPKVTLKKRKLPVKAAASTVAAHESKKPKLFTLRASRSEYSDDEEAEAQWEEEEQPECSSARESSVFVPASLRSPNLLMATVEESVEELDVLVNMPDVLDITQDALSPDATCELAHNETGLAEPLEHQLDLLVDVIDCLSSDYAIAEDESYNEAAHTLLTIGNVTQFPENETVVQDHSTADSTPDGGGSETLDQVVAESSAAVDSQEKTKDDEDGVSVKAGPPPTLPSPERPEKMPPPSRKGRSQKIKPAPNLGLASRSKRSGHPGDSGSEEQATRESTENTPKSEDSPPVQESCEDPAPATAPVKVSRDVKPQPDLTKTTRSSRSKPQATKEPQESNSGPSFAPEPSAPLQALPTDSSAAMSDESREDQTPLETAPEPKQTSENTGETAACHPQASASSPGAGSDLDSASGEPHVSQKEDSPRPPVKSRFQKIKAKPNLTQATRSARSRPQASKAPEEKVSSPAPTSESHQRPAADVAAELPEKNQSAALAPELKSSLDVDATESPSTPAEKEGGETAETPPGAGSDPDVAPVGESHVGQKEGPLQPPARSRFQKIKPKPNLALASRSARLNPKDSSCNVTPVPEVHPVEGETKLARIASSENAASTSDLKLLPDAAAPPTTEEDLHETDVGALVQEKSSAAIAGGSLVQEQAAAAAAAAAATVSAPSKEPGSKEKSGETSLMCHTRRREKVKPKPRLTGRCAASKTPPVLNVPLTGQRIVAEAEQTETQSPLKQSQTESPVATSLPELEQKPEETSLTGEQRTDLQNDQGSTSEASGMSLALRRRFFKVKPNLGSFARKSSSGQQPEVSEPPLAGEHNQEVAPGSGSPQKTESDELPARPESEACPGQESSEPEIKSDQIQPAEVREEILQSGDAVQQLLESSPPASHSERESKSSGKAPQSSRGRLFKPKPNIALGRRAKQQKESKAKDAVTLPEAVGILKGGGEASEGRTDTMQPAGGATEQPAHREASEVVEPLSQDEASGSPAGSFTGIIPSSLFQEGETSSAGGENQAQCGLKLFSDILSEQVPSDPDEPFFILSLTEVPLGEAAVGGASGAPPPPTPLGPLNSSSLQHVPLVEASGGSVNVSETPPRDSEASAPHQEPPASRNPAGSPEKGNERRPSGSKRQRSSQAAAAKVPTQPRTSTVKRGSGKTPAEAGSSERNASKCREDRGDVAEVAQEEDPQGGGGSQAQEKKAVSCSPPSTGRNQEGAASTSVTVAAPPPGSAAPLEAPAGSSAELGPSAEETQAASCGLGGPAGGPVSSEPAWGSVELLDSEPGGIQESSCRSEEDEPTGVSQYFLSDIFTEVEHE